LVCSERPGPDGILSSLSSPITVTIAVVGGVLFA
jgi:hypothetical protein